MEVLKRQIKYTPVDLDPIEMTLLSREEYELYEHNISLIDDFWWLRSPGYIQGSAARVNPDGSLYNCSVDYSYAAVRPALKFNAQNLRIADKFKFYEYEWTVIAEGIALCDDVFCRMVFREVWQAPDANDFQRSDVKTYLDSQFEQMKEK